MTVILLVLILIAILFPKQFRTTLGFLLALIGVAFVAAALHIDGVIQAPTFGDFGRIPGFVILAALAVGAVVWAVKLAKYYLY